MAHVVERLGRHWSDGARAEQRRLRRRDLRYLLAPSRLARLLGGELPQGAIFLHAYHSPFPAMFRWLKARPDLKPVFFVHDLLALQMPEYFTPEHVAYERRWHEVLVDHGAAAIVNSAAVKADLESFLEDRNAKAIPILAAPIPVDPVFCADDLADPALREDNYFVVCGTIEPRKNHLLLLQVWRELVRRCDDAAPKLLVLGRRGWKNQNVVELLERSNPLRGRVVEKSGLSSHALARLMANSRAVLMPSFGEGYGLPIAEALAAGAPVIASDIPVFRESEGLGAVTFVSPLDGMGWLAAVMAHAEGDRMRPPPRHRVAPESYFARLDAFLAEVAAGA